jgi:hypothetical protein
MPVLRTPKRHKPGKNANYGIEFFAHRLDTLLFIHLSPISSSHILRYLRKLYDKVSTTFEAAGDVSKDCERVDIYDNCRRL